ncbi:MAG TPA: hypothetical protein VFV51_07945 [Vicinamibacterales bacterium]|nr:hypothetical protein [Vicinamibacterales bacterium]
MIDVESYCRDLEAYLCRKNDGHLIRITGPAFEKVQGWAHQGIPLKVAEAGIDRYFERYYRKGPRRRPVQIAFCEPDVLDAFDDWRRAVGISRVAADVEGGPEVEEPLPESRPRKSLASQIESALARLTVLRGSDKAGPELGAALDGAVRGLDAIRADASRARGEARDQIIERMSAIDDQLLAAAVDSLDPDTRTRYEKEADAELAPFRARMADDAYRLSHRAAVHRLVRHHFGLPAL